MSQDVKCHVLRAGTEVRILIEGHFEFIDGLAFHPTEDCFVTASADGNMNFFDCERMEKTFTLTPGAPPDPRYPPGAFTLA